MTTNTDVAMPELLPCPFCGDSPKVSDRASTDTATGHVWFIACFCGGYSANAHQHGDTKRSAAAKWNRRAAIQQAAGAVPEGWRLVPIEPTPEMLKGGGQRIAMNEQYVGPAESKAGFVWRDMLAAALNIKLPGQFYPGMTATESEFANDLYYGKERKTAMLAASPFPPKQQPVHLAGGEAGGVPLTDDQVRKVYRSVFDENAPRIYGIAERFARAIEAAHGIGKAPRPESPTGQINKPATAGQGME